MPFERLLGCLQEVADERLVRYLGPDSRSMALRLSRQSRGRRDDAQAAPVVDSAEDVLHELFVALEGEVLVEAYVGQDGRLAAKALPDRREGGLRSAEVEPAQVVYLREVIELVKYVAAGMDEHSSELL